MARTIKELEKTITPELFEAWSRLRRKGDPETIAAELGKSRPVIDKALKYGFVKDQVVVDGITRFYNERREKELAEANNLNKKK